MNAFKIPKLSFADYLQIEIDSDIKHEYHDGQIYALAGGTLNHATISGNVFREIGNHLKVKQSKCVPFNSDAKLHIEALNSYVYPDSMVVCEEIENENYVTNPVLIIEVLSKSTAAYDRGDKFYKYRQIPTFKEYVLIEQDKYVVDICYKHPNSDLWSFNRYEGLATSIQLQSIDLEITMEDLYYRTKIESVGN